MNLVPRSSSYAGYTTIVIDVMLEPRIPTYRVIMYCHDFFSGLVQLFWAHGQ